MNDIPLYKLTDQQGRTRGTCQWGWGVTHEASDNTPPMLCTASVIHAYIDPQLGAFLNPIHAAFNNPIFWEAEGLVVVNNNQKVGCKSLTTWNTIDIVLPNKVQRRAFAIMSALELNGKGFRNRDIWKTWEGWALKWLSGEDRTGTSRVNAYASVSTSAYASAFAFASAASVSAFASADAYAYADAYAITINGPRIAREAMLIT